MKLINQMKRTYCGKTIYKLYTDLILHSYRAGLKLDLKKYTQVKYSTGCTTLGAVNPLGTPFYEDQNKIDLKLSYRE